MPVASDRTRFATVVYGLTLLAVVVGVVGSRRKAQLPSPRKEISRTSSAEDYWAITRRPTATLVRQMREALFEDVDEIQFDDLVPILSEMERRGDAVFAREIQDVLTEMDQRAIVHHDRAMVLSSRLPDWDPEGDWNPAWTAEHEAIDYERNMEFDLADRYRDTLALVTSLRRLRNQPTPVRVRFTAAHYHAEWPDLPRVALEFLNTDPSRAFHFAVALIPVRPNTGGCLVIREHNTGVATEPLGLEPGSDPDPRHQLAPGEFDTVSVNLIHHFYRLPPGEYDLFLDDPCFTASCRITISRRSISLVAREQNAIKRWLDELDRSQPPRLLSDPYSLWITEKIPLTTPLGKLLLSRWRAVPALLDELEDSSRSSADKAHTLAMLYSITGQIDPRWPDGKPVRRGWSLNLGGGPSGPSPLGPFISHRPNVDHHWLHDRGAVLGATSLTYEKRVGFPKTAQAADRSVATDEGQPIAISSAASAKGLHVDANAQQPLIARWRQLRAYIRVTTPPPGGGGLAPARGLGGGTGFF